MLVGGSPRSPEVLANKIVEVVTGPERFCFHSAMDMTRAAAEEWIARAKEMALANARRALSPLFSQSVQVCAVVARQGAMGDIGQIVSSHARVHTAEGCFYRDIFRAACPVPTRVIAPSTLDPSTVGKLAAPPWGRDQKLAALAAWMALKPESKAKPHRAIHSA